MHRKLLGGWALPGSGRRGGNKKGKIGENLSPILILDLGYRSRWRYSYNRNYATITLSYSDILVTDSKGRSVLICNN